MGRKGEIFVPLQRGGGSAEGIGRPGSSCLRESGTGRRRKGRRNREMAGGGERDGVPPGEGAEQEGEFLTIEKCGKRGILYYE